MDGLRPMSGISLPSPSPQSARFSQAAYDIPTRRPKNKIPTILKPWVVGVTVVTMLVLAGGVEVALFYSNKHQGFPMGNLSTDLVQWLSGFIPVLIIGPLVMVWKQTDRAFKKLQPYVVLSQGPARAEESVLMDLEHDNMFTTLSRALSNGHYLIIFSTLIVLANILLHPLAGAFFLVKPALKTGPSDVPVQSLATIGLNPSYKDLTSFVAAAGYAEAAAMYNLSDPPFVKGPWAVAPFQFPLDPTRNATLSVNTTGIHTNVSCSALHVQMMPPTTAAPNNWTLAASLPARPGCNASQAIDSTAAEFQYGVDIVPGCSPNSSEGMNRRDQAFDPILPPVFWFASIPRSNTPLQNNTASRRAPTKPAGSAILCLPTIAAYTVHATSDSSTGLLDDVERTVDLALKTNNVTGGDFAGKAFNGLFFNEDSDFNLNDPFINARASAVQSGIPGAIFVMASNSNQQGNLDTVFDNTAGFLGFTGKLYTQYLSLVAQSNYFVPIDNAHMDADITMWSNRLWISPITAHCLACLLVLVAASGAFIHTLHNRQRKRLYLASRPGSMAHYMSLLSHPQSTSPFPKDDDNGNVVQGLVGPLDDEKMMRNKLAGLRFMVDERAGTIVPVSAREPWTTRDKRGRSSGYDTVYELEDPRRALLSPGIPGERS